MRHRARPHLPVFGLLLNIPLGDVLPTVSAQTDQNGVESSYFSHDSAQTIVRLNLSGVGVEGQSQTVLHKGAGNAGPVELGIHETVSVVVTDCSIELPPYLSSAQFCYLQRQPECKIGVFLSEGSRRGRLSVGVRQHGVRCPLLTEICDFSDDLGGFREEDVFEGLLEHEGVGQVIDVFAGAAEVDVLFVVTYVVLYVVFHRFQVVVRPLLYALHLLPASLIKIGH